MIKTSKHNSLSRRQFIKSVPAALAVPCIVPASALGAGDSVPPSERITLGIIGTGGRGQSNMRSFLPLSGAEVVAVCDVFRDRREKAARVVAQHYGNEGNRGCQAYNDFRDVLARDDIDAVVVSPQDHWHAPIVVAATRAGKDVYCEKPLGVAVSEGEAIRDAVRRYSRVFQTGTQQRSDRKFQLACNLARSGKLGEIHTIEVAAPGPRYRPRYDGPYTAQPVPDGFDYDMYVGPAPWKPFNPCRIDWPGWYLIWDYCAGFIVNWGVHHLDIAHWGMPSISATGCRLSCKAVYRTHPICDNIESWQADFIFDDGLKMRFTDTGNPLPQGTRFIGEEGWVHVNRGGIRAEPASLLDARIEPVVYESRHHHGDFLECVRQRRDPVAPVEAGHVASYFGMIAETAGRLERELRWDPNAEQFVEDAEANRLLKRPMRSPWRV